MPTGEVPSPSSPGKAVWDRLEWLSLGLVPIFAVAALLFLVPTPASASSNVIQVSKTRGVKRIGNLRIISGRYPTNLSDAAAVFGRPGLIRRPYREVCNAYFGRGLRLDFVSYGLVYGCYERSLQAGLIRSRYWKVKVGKRLYRVGMPKRRVPRGARFIRGFGYELATIPFIGRRTGSVYAMIGSKKKIMSFRLFVGLAGD